MKNIGIIYCQKIQDRGCIGCSKCYKALSKKIFAFEGEDRQMVFKTGCGDCPGLVLPRMELQQMVLKNLSVGLDEVYFGTCVQKAKAAMNCPMNLDVIKEKIKAMTDAEVHVGTHEF